MSGSVTKVWQHQSKETGPLLKLKMVYYTLFCVALGRLFNLSELTYAPARMTTHSQRITGETE